MENNRAAHCAVRCLVTQVRRTLGPHMDFQDICYLIVAHAGPLNEHSPSYILLPVINFLKLFCESSKRVPGHLATVEFWGSFKIRGLFSVHSAEGSAATGSGFRVQGAPLMSVETPAETLFECLLKRVECLIICPEVTLLISAVLLEWSLVWDVVTFVRTR